MPKVSVIIPAYNAEQFIEKCANSVLHQTLQDIEIIFIDDGSTDKTGEILDELTNSYTNAHVVHQKNQGLYKTRENGLNLAQGDYVGWVDADDFVELNMFELLYNTAISNNSELVLCDYTWFPSKIATKEKWFRSYQGKVDTTFVERNSQPWNKIVKRELLNKLNIGKYFVSCFDEIYIRVLMEAKNPVAVDQKLYNYRVGSGTMSSAYTNVKHYRKFVEASKELKKLMHPLMQQSYWKAYFDYRIIYYLLMTMIVAANAGDKDAYELNRKELLAIKPKYSKNQHYWRILKNNFGLFKSIVIGGIMPLNYSIAHLACRIGMR